MNGCDVHRRSLLTLLGTAAAAWPLAAGAQQRAARVIGVIGSGTAEVYSNSLEIFKQGIRETAVSESQNLRFEYRWANNQFDLLPAMAEQLVRSQVTLIFAIGNSLPAFAAKNATSNIPIVFSMGADPVKIGVVPSLNRPGGNITGVANVVADLIPKRMQLLHEVVPTAAFGCLYNPDSLGRTSDGRTVLEAAEGSARALGQPIVFAPARTINDFDAAFGSLVEKGAAALLTTGDAVFSGGERLIALAEQYRKPMIYHGSPTARAGGLMSYTASFADSMRNAGRYVGRLFKGEKPANLPVLLPTKFEFIINLKTAKSLGLTIPPGVLAIVDEVIE